MNDAQRKLLRDEIDDKRQEANRLEALLRDGATPEDYYRAKMEWLRVEADLLSAKLSSEP